MLETILNRLYARVSGEFHKVEILAELLEKDRRVTPVVYSGNGQYKPIDIDHFNGVAYFRRNGKTYISEVEVRLPMPHYRYEYPIRLVGAVKNEVLTRDDSFSSDALATRLTKLLIESNTSLITDLSAKECSVIVESYDTERTVIMGTEYEGTGKVLPMNYSAVSVDIRVSIIISKDCINTFCNSYCNG